MEIFNVTIYEGLHRLMECLPLRFKLSVYRNRHATCDDKQKNRFSVFKFQNWHTSKTSTQHPTRLSRRHGDLSHEFLIYEVCIRWVFSQRRSLTY